jgi:hypothetical protein
MDILTPKEFTKSAQLLAPVSLSASSLSAAFDTTGFSGGYAVFFVNIGVIADGASFTGSIHESATSGGSYATIANSGFTITGTNDGTMKRIQIRLERRLPFLKVDLVYAGSGAGLITASAIAFRPDSQRDITLDTFDATAD